MESEEKQFTASGLTARLFERIGQMPEQRKKELLILMGDQREYERLPYLMQIVCETDDVCFTDFILDISPCGVFLETIQELFLGQKLTMVFQFKGVDAPVSITGSVTWIGKNGVGVNFVFDSQKQKQAMIDHVDRLR